MRVFVTGLGALTACGDTEKTTWEAIKEGRTGITEISYWNLESWPTKLAGQLKNFQAARLLPDKKLIKAISRQDVMGIHAASKAIEDANLIPYRDGLSSPQNFNDETGIYVGSPGNKFFQQYDFLPLVSKTKGEMTQFAHNLFDEVHPMWLLRILPNNVLAYTGITYGFKGANHNITNHAVGSTQAILEAFHAIRSGQIKRAVVVGYDLSFEPQSLFYYANLNLVSAQHLKPFDKDHDGTILAEGAAALVLESEASAKERNANCYAEIKGGLSSSERAGMFSIKQQGDVLANLMEDTLKQTGLNAKDIDFVVAHGNGNPLSDDTEAEALSKVCPHSPPVTAFKWAMGHTITASGLIDTVMMTKAMQDNCLPGIPNFEEGSPASRQINVIKTNRALTKKDHALLINRGFGSMNACLVVKACD